LDLNKAKGYRKKEILTNEMVRRIDWRKDKEKDTLKDIHNMKQSGFIEK
jgi:hypothetical protein